MSAAVGAGKPPRDWRPLAQWANAEEDAEEESDEEEQEDEAYPTGSAGGATPFVQLYGFSSWWLLPLVLSTLVVAGVKLHLLLFKDEHWDFQTHFTEVLYVWYLCLGCIGAVMCRVTTGSEVFVRHQATRPVHPRGCFLDLVLDCSSHRICLRPWASRALLVSLVLSWAAGPSAVYLRAHEDFKRTGSLFYGVPPIYPIASWTFFFGSAAVFSAGAAVQGTMMAVVWCFSMDLVQGVLEDLKSADRIDWDARAAQVVSVNVELEELWKPTNVQSWVWHSVLLNALLSCISAATGVYGLPGGSPKYVLHVLLFGYSGLVFVILLHCLSRVTSACICDTITEVSIPGVACRRAANTRMSESEKASYLIFLSVVQRKNMGIRILWVLITHPLVLKVLTTIFGYVPAAYTLLTRCLRDHARASPERQAFLKLS